ncbi:MAG: AAA family ATPase, partial [Phycisphaerae bacterium]
NVLLQLLDDGRLTDGHGRTVDFRNTLIAMTSNLGSEYIRSITESQRRSDTGELRGGDDSDDILTEVEIEMRIKEELKKHFRPEFLNRIDETIVFHALRREDLRRIAEIQIEHLRERLACGTGFQPVGLTLTLTPAAMDKLARDGYDPTFGARPLKRLIQQEIENPLARRILAGEFAPGDGVEIDVRGEMFAFGKETKEPVGV